MLQQLAPYLRVVFDVGANVGDWTHAAHSASPSAQVHSFEIIPETALRLKERFSTVPEVRVSQIGLLEAPGSTQVFYYPENSTVSSVVPFPHDVAHESVAATVSTGDLYCDEVGVDRIDLLKVDTEGTELSVLKGFERRLADQRVVIVQFEYGLTSILTKDLLRDFYDYLSPLGYHLGKLYPNYVDFHTYDLSRHEDFIGPNYVAVVGTRDDLIGRLS